MRPPKTVKRNKEAISKEDVAEIINQCSDIRLKTYVMLLAAAGMRDVEGLCNSGNNGNDGLRLHEVDVLTDYLQSYAHTLSWIWQRG